MCKKLSGFAYPFFVRFANRMDLTLTLYGFAYPFLLNIQLPICATNNLFPSALWRLVQMTESRRCEARVLLGISKYPFSRQLSQRLRSTGRLKGYSCIGTASCWRKCTRCRSSRHNAGWWQLFLEPTIHFTTYSRCAPWAPMVPAQAGMAQGS